MAFKIMEQGRKPNTIWQTFMCDTNDDVANLPTNCPAGSRAIVAQNGDLYLLDSLGNWNPMPRGGGGGGGGGSDVIANPVLEGNEERLNGLEVDGVKYANPKEIVYLNAGLDLSNISYQNVQDAYANGGFPVIVYSGAAYLPTLPSTAMAKQFARTDVNGNLVMLRVDNEGGETHWNVTSFPNFSALVLYYDGTEISTDDYLACISGTKIPVLVDYNTGDYVLGTCIDNNKIVFNAIKVGEGKLVRYTYMLGDSSPWNRQEIPLGMLANFYCEPNTTTFTEIVSAVITWGQQPLINDIANGRCYYVSGYTLSNGDPVAIRFCTLEKDDSGLRYTWTVDYQDNWTSGSYMDGLYYVVPGTTTFMEIIGLLTKCTQPVINDTVNGRAYYISDYTMVGGQPAAITFSTIGANTPHTWTVDYQDNWTST